MSVRDVMEKAILNAGMNMGALAHRRADTFEGKIVDLQIEALTAAGFPIVHKDEIHAPSVEICARVIDDFQEVVSLRTSARFLIGRSEGNLVGIAYAAALRKLMKEVK